MTLNEKEKLRLLKENYKIKYCIIDLIDNIGNTNKELTKYLLDIIDFNYKEDCDFQKMKEKYEKIEKLAKRGAISE